MKTFLLSSLFGFLILQFNGHIKTSNGEPIIEEPIVHKSGLPYHKMLDHFVKGIVINPALGEEIPSAELISDFETQIGWTFPKEYTDFQLKYGAVFLHVHEDIWTQPKTGSVVPFWATNYGFIIYGFSNGGPDFSDFVRKHNQFKEHFPDLPFFMPIHRKVAGDGTYIGFDKSGKLVEARPHENRLISIGMDFDSFVIAEAADLKKRMDRRIEYNNTGEWPKN